MQNFVEVNYCINILSNKQNQQDLQSSSSPNAVDLHLMASQWMQENAQDLKSSSSPNAFNLHQISRNKHTKTPSDHTTREVTIGWPTQDVKSHWYTYIQNKW